MARRYSGDVAITILYVGTTPDNRESYQGTIGVTDDSGNRRVWGFADLCSGVGGVSSGKGYRYASDAPEAYDRMAESALSFAAYYSSDNRSPFTDDDGDTPDWAPPADVADLIGKLADYASDDDARSGYIGDMFRVTRRRGA